MNVENVLYDLYEVLECLKYPELAQTPFREFENLLKGRKRTNLFLWLLQQLEELQQLLFLKEIEHNEEVLKHKLFECYTQFGLCENIDVFFGNCPMIQQLTFLNFLTLFIKRVHLTEDDVKSKKQIVNTSFNDSFSSKSFGFPRLDQSGCQILNPPSPKVGILPEIITKDNLERSLEKFQTDLKQIQEDEIQNMDEILNNFDTAFSPTVFERQHKNSNNPTNFNKDLTLEFKDLHDHLSIISKTQANQEAIRSKSLPEPITRTKGLLSKMIQDTLVVVEQACNVLNEDLPKNSTFN